MYSYGYATLQRDALSEGLVHIDTILHEDRDRIGVLVSNGQEEQRNAILVLQVWVRALEREHCHEQVNKHVFISNF